MRISDFYKNMKVTGVEIMQGYPYKDAEDDTLYYLLCNVTLEDGTVLEFCVWGWDGLNLIDVSVPKTKFGGSTGKDFEAYLIAQGITTDPVPEDDEERTAWYYAGAINMPDCWRVQYALEKDREHQRSLEWGKGKK